MSITSGFFNSIDGDRKYNAEQMSAIFDGIINDGIYASIGTAFVVNANSGNDIIVGKGRAWFNSTWVYNDAPLPMTTDISEILLDRYDAVVIEVSRNDAVREGSVKIIKGTPSSDPQYPTLTDTVDTHQYPLAYIYRKANSEEITQADITNMVGSEQTPFVTGIIQVISLDLLLGQWRDELDQFVVNETNDFNTWYASMKQMIDDTTEELNSWAENEKQKFTEWTEAEQVEFNEWAENQQALILGWFDRMKNQLSEDAAINLQLQIDDLNSEVETQLNDAKTDLQTQAEANKLILQTMISNADIERMLMVGLTDGDKTISDDGSTITSVDSVGRILVKTFSQDYSTCTSVLSDSNGTVLGSLYKEFSSDEKSTNTTFILGE